MLALRTALVVLRSAGSKLRGASVGTALAVMLAVGGANGCTSSHNNLPDLDGDGFVVGDDCDDTDPTIYPGAPEDICPDGADQNCDGEDGEAICNPFEDVDGDGYSPPEDCNDNNAAIHPGAAEDCCDIVDMDCDGVIDMCTNCFSGVDADGDGYFVDDPWLESDCDDSDPDIYPGAPEICGDGIDQNCSGADGEPGIDCPTVNPLPDADGDGYDISVDCDDDAWWINPGAVEDCFDGVDNDCDGEVDEEPAEGCWFMNGMLDVEAEDPKSAPTMSVPTEGDSELA